MLFDSHPWLEEHLEKSVTEMEIFYGVLRNPSMNERAFFYFRDPEYTLSNENAEDFTESDSELTKRLNTLKERIRSSRCRLRENYLSPEELGDFVLEDLWHVIDSEFPAGSEPDPLTREITDHEQFAETRRKVYIGRDEYYQRLDKHVNSQEPPLIISGESGSGKSALMANWADRYNRKNPDRYIIQHFVGSTVNSTSHISLIKRILDEIKLRFDYKEELPADGEAMIKALPKWLSVAAAKGGMIIIIDGLNQIEDNGNAHELYWLPESYPPEIKVIISILPGKMTDKLLMRGWPLYNVTGLQNEEKMQMITGYLSRYRKTLDTSQLQLITDSEQTSNPLYLKALLDELRVFGVYEKLNERIEYYLKAKTPADLYEKILERIEEDYESRRPRLVKDTLSLLWCSRKGLSDTEILDMAGEPGNPLPQILWSPLFLALEESLVNRQGLLNFFHDYLREAVYERYIRSADNENSVRERIVEYFISSETDYRKSDELPWQLKKLGKWDDLAAVMQDADLLNLGWNRNEYEVKEYWTLIDNKTGLTAGEAMKKIVSKPDHEPYVLWNICTLLNDLGFREEAFSLLQHLNKTVRDDPKAQQSILNKKATILRDWGQMEEAMKTYKEYEDLARKTGDAEGIQTSLNNQAVILGMWGRYEEAFIHYKEEEKTAMQKDDKYSLIISLTNQAQTLHHWGKFDEALEIASRAEKLCRETGDRSDLYLILGNKAVLLKDLGRNKEAITLLRECESGVREIGDKESLATHLLVMAEIMHKDSNPDEALRLYREAEVLFRQLGNKSYLSKSLGSQAAIISEMGDHEEALRMLDNAAVVFRELNDMDSLATNMTKKALLLSLQEDFDGALALLDQAEPLFRELGSKKGLCNCLASKSQILQTKVSKESLLPLYEELEPLCRELGLNDKLQYTLADHAAVLGHQQRWDEAMTLYAEEESLCRIRKDEGALQENLSFQAIILYATDRKEEALKLYNEEAELCMKLGRKTELLENNEYRISILNEMSRYEECLTIYKEEEALLHDEADKEKLAINLGNQGLVLCNLDRFEEGLEAHVHSGRLFTETGNNIGHSIALCNQALIKRELGDITAALEIHKKEEKTSRKARFKEGLQRSLGYQALIYIELKQPRKALRLLRKQKRIADKSDITIQDIFVEAMSKAKEEISKKPRN